MIKLCAVDEVRAAERRAIEQGRSVSDLMVMAGHGFAGQILAERPRQPGTAVFLVGPGNNGGDGLVAAAALAARGWSCSVWPFSRRDRGSAPVTDADMRSVGWLARFEDGLAALRRADLVVDAVFGIGGRGELPAEVRRAIDAARAERVWRGAALWALDVPSGVGSDTGEVAEGAFTADVTVMLGLPKIGLFKAPALRHTGELRLLDIGLEAGEAGPGQPVMLTLEAVRQWLPRRPADSHKSAVGWLMVIGGSPNYYGAPRLAAEAALRAGAGLVNLAVARSLIPVIASALPEVTFTPLPDSEIGAGATMAASVRAVIGRYRALLIGPGLGLDHPVDDFLAALLGFRSGQGSLGFGTSTAPDEAAEPFRASAVIDADGLNWLATRPAWADRLREAPLVLTPHPGELARLLDVDTGAIVADPWRAALDAASRFGQVVVLKHAHTAVATPDGRLMLSAQALPSLATAGTGDVLAGLIAGLLAQGLTPAAAAAAGVAVGVEAALRATGEAGTLGLVASDLPRQIASVLRDLYDANPGRTP